MDSTFGTAEPRITSFSYRWITWGFMTGSMLTGKDKLDAGFYRNQLFGMSTQLHGSRPLVFFDNHNNV
jgi:hypothetical protein